MPGFDTILNQLAEAYKSKKQEIHTTTSEFMHALSHSAKDVEEKEENIERSISR